MQSWIGPLAISGACLAGQLDLASRAQYLLPADGLPDASQQNLLNAGRAVASLLGSSSSSVDHQAAFRDNRMAVATWSTKDMRLSSTLSATATMTARLSCT